MRRFACGHLPQTATPNSQGKSLQLLIFELWLLLLMKRLFHERS